MKMQRVNIEYQPLTEKEHALYRHFSKKSLIIRSVVFFVLLPLIVIACVDFYKSASKPFLCSFFICSTLVLSCFAEWVYIYAGKPRGCRYGRISKKTRVYRGKYSGYVFNVYFEDIHKSLINQYIQPIRKHPVIMPNDSVFVVKSRHGANFIIPIYDEQKTDEFN